MWKRAAVLGVVVLTCLQMHCAGRGAAGSTVTGVTIYKPEKCREGATLVPYEEGMILLIDMKGNVLHEWEIGTERARLLRNGNVLVMERNFMREYNWEGERVWEYEVPVKPDPDRGYPNPGLIHHDHFRLDNGNTIFIYHEDVPDAYIKSIKDPERRGMQIVGDCICEVNRAGEIVWEFHLHEHLDLNEYSPDAPADWTHTNTVRVLPENKWYDRGYAPFKPGNVVLCMRHLDKIMIIDRDTKEVIWTFRGDYLGGLGCPHEPYMIEKGLPGDGNILIFDNGVGPYARAANRPETSVVLEINPATKEIVWMYDEGEAFFSAIQGTQQRLPNGNTFICESTQGRIFEVTPEKEIVWEYVMPPYPGSGEEHGFGTRPHRYAFDHCPQLAVIEH